jgi:hypothetical protein
VHLKWHLCQPNFLGLKPKINVPVSLVKDQRSCRAG